MCLCCSTNGWSQWTAAWGGRSKLQVEFLTGAILGCRDDLLTLATRKNYLHAKWLSLVTLRRHAATLQLLLDLNQPLSTSLGKSQRLDQSGSPSEGGWGRSRGRGLLECRVIRFTGPLWAQCPALHCDTKSMLNVCCVKSKPRHEWRAGVSVCVFVWVCVRVGAGLFFLKFKSDHCPWFKNLCD